MSRIHNTAPHVEVALPITDTVPRSNVSFSQLVVAVIGFAGIALAAFFGLQSQRGSDSSSELQLFITAQVSVNEQLTKRVDVLELENITLTKLNALQTIQIATMKFEASARRTETQVYVDFIRSFPVPAWIKGPAGNNTFKMISINKEFTARYGKTDAQYEGQPDHAVFPKDLADSYLLIDREVVRTGEPAITQFESIIDGKRVMETSIKFRVLLGNGEFGVAGFIFP